MEKVTYQGYCNIVREIQQIYKIIPSIIENIREAKSRGDLSENAEYVNETRKKRDFEERLTLLEEYINHCAVIREVNILNHIDFGATVTISNLKTGKIHQYTLVGLHETDLEKSKIYYKSPLGIALMNKKNNDKIEIEIKGQKFEYIITSFEYNAQTYNSENINR